MGPCRRYRRTRPRLHRHTLLRGRGRRRRRRRRWCTRTNPCAARGQPRSRRGFRHFQGRTQWLQVATGSMLEESIYQCVLHVYTCVCLCVCLCLSVSVCLCVCRTRRLSQSVSCHPCVACTYVCTHMSAGHGHITSDSKSSTVAAAQAHISQTLEPGTIVSLISKSELRCPHLARGVTDAIAVPVYFPRLSWSPRDSRISAAAASSERGWSQHAQRACLVSQQSPAARSTAAPHASESPLGWHSRLLTHERERMQVSRAAGCD